MQKQQQEHRFSNASAQQPIYRFPQNQNTMGWQPQQSFSAQMEPTDNPSFTAKNKHEIKKTLHKRRRIFTLWNLFAVIGMITTLIQVARYIVIPALVYLNVLAGGVK